jgi:sugar phosphate isomerase/epimerase
MTKQKSKGKGKIQRIAKSLSKGKANVKVMVEASHLNKNQNELVHNFISKLFERLQKFNFVDSDKEALSVDDER